MPRTPAGVETIPVDYAQIVREQERRHKQRFAVGDLVRLAPDVGTKTQQRLVYRIAATIPVKGQHRTDYSIEPVTGGRSSRAQAVHLDPATPDDQRRYADAAPVPRLFVGTVVVDEAGRLRGADPFTKLVVIAEASDGTVKVTRLGGDGGKYWSKVRTTDLRVVAP